MIGTFRKNILITFVTRASAAVFGVGISIIIARTLGPEGKGIYSLAILLPALLVTFTNLGINPATVFYVAKKKYSSKEVFGNNIIFTGLISLFAILGGLGIIFFFSDKLFNGVEKEYLLLALCLIPFSLFFDFISHIFIGLQKIKKYNIISFLQSFLVLILIGVLLLGFKFGITAAIAAQIVVFLLAGIVLFFLVKSETEGIFLKPNKQYLKDASSYGLKAHLGGVISFLHLRADLFLINIFLNPLAVGFYSVAVALSEGMRLIPRSVGTVLFPKVASETDPESLKKFTPLVGRNVLLATLLVAILLFVFSHWLVVLLYSQAFLESIQPFRILLIGAPAFCGHTVLIHDLMARGKPMLVSCISGISLVLNIILNILWIPMLGIIGAAWATAISYSVMFMITIFIYGRISGNKIKDIIIPQKSDFQYYKNLLLSIKLVKH